MKKEGGKPGAFHMAMYLVFFVLGARFGWLWGHQLGGTALGIIFAVGGAIIASTAVGVVATLLGYRA